MVDLSAQGALAPGEIELALGASGGLARPRMIVVRRRGGPPADAEDGLRVFDLTAMFRDATTPWERVACARYLVVNAVAEAGLRQAEVTSFFGSSAGAPARVSVAIWTGATGTARAELADVSRVESTTSSSGSFARVVTTDVFVRPGGGAEQPAGRLVVSTEGLGAAAPPSQIRWEPAAGAPVTAPFDVEELETTTRTAPLPGATGWDFATTQRASIDGHAADVRVRTVHIEEHLDPDAGEVTRAIRVADREPSSKPISRADAGLTPEIVYSYATFIAGGGGALPARPDATATAIPTGDYGLGDRMYRLLPAIHRALDEPDAQTAGVGQLRRFLSVFGAALDQTRGLAEALVLRHDVLHARADALPHLARAIGWDLDRTLSDRAQRTDILFAPDVFATAGTVPTLQALVNRTTARPSRGATGWVCQVKEFYENVFLTNAAEPMRLREIWQSAFDGASWGSPAIVAGAPVPKPTRWFDGRPAIAFDAGGARWVFFHSGEAHAAGSPGRQIWLARAGDAPIAVRGAGEVTAPDVVDESPAAVTDGSVVLLFWHANREGSFDIYSREFAGPAAGPRAGAGPAVRVTSHPTATDRAPAAVRDANGRIWLFWESNRRGTTDIWAQVRTGAAWSAPRRVSDGPLDRAPCAALDASGNVNVFFSAYRGDRTIVLQSTLIGDTFTAPSAVAPGEARPGARDEAPAAALFQGRMWLLWHSNRGGRFRLWFRTQQGGAWGAGAPVPAPVPPRFTEDAEPAIAASGAALHLVFRSQRSGEFFVSRTVDTADLAPAKRRGEVDDRWHYAYDAGTSPTSWYARGTVGMYLTPKDGLSDAAHAEQLERLQQFVEPFRPIFVRFAWFLQRQAP